MSSLAGEKCLDEVPGAVLIVYSRPRCHLCDVAKRELEPLLAGTGIRLLERNVEERPEWEHEYGEQIPVGVINGRRIFKYRVDSERVRRALIEVLEHGL